VENIDDVDFNLIWKGLIGISNRVRAIVACWIHLWDSGLYLCTSRIELQQVSARNGLGGNEGLHEVNTNLILNFWHDSSVKLYCFSLSLFFATKKSEIATRGDRVDVKYLHFYRFFGFLRIELKSTQVIFKWISITIKLLPLCISMRSFIPGAPYWLFCHILRQLCNSKNYAIGHFVTYYVSKNGFIQPASSRWQDYYEIYYLSLFLWTFVYYPKW